MPIRKLSGLAGKNSGGANGVYKFFQVEIRAQNIRASVNVSMNLLAKAVDDQSRLPIAQASTQKRIVFREEVILDAGGLAHQVFDPHLFGRRFCCELQIQVFPRQKARVAHRFPPIVGVNNDIPVSVK